MSTEQSLDPHLIEQTKQQIRGLVAEIAQLAKSEIGPEDFHEQFLPKVVSALAAVGIPALQFARSGATGGYMHTSMDDIRFISAAALAKAGRFVELYLRRHFVAAKALPVPREIPDDQKKELDGFKKAQPKRKTKRGAKAAK